MSKTAIWLGVLALLPTLLDYGFRVEYKAHAAGGVVISGASSGIGLHSAFDLASRGFVVYAGVRKESDAAAIRERAKAENVAVVPVELEVTSQESVVRSVETVLADLKTRGLPLVGLINNAGVSASALPMEVVPLEKAAFVWDVNLMGVLRLTQAYLPHIRHAKGRVINIGSVAGLVATKNSAVYSASKFGLEAMTDALRREVSHHFGVAVSIVEPAYVKTEIGGKALGENSPVKQISQEQAELYAHTLGDEEEKRIENFAKAAGPEVTSEAIAHALISPYPRTRYAVAGAKGLPAWLVVRLTWLVPDHVLDYMLRTVFA